MIPMPISWPTTRKRFVNSPTLKRDSRSVRQPKPLATWPATMAACGTQEQHASVLAALRAVYLPWLETSAAHLQQLIHDHGLSMPRRSSLIEPAPGRVVLFADGLRLDVGQQLAQRRPRALEKLRTEESIGRGPGRLRGPTGSGQECGEQQNGRRLGGEP